MLACQNEERVFRVPELQIKETNKLKTISISNNLMLIRHLLEWPGNALFLVVISLSRGQGIVLFFIRTNRNHYARRFTQTPDQTNNL